MAVGRAGMVLVAVLLGIGCGPPPLEACRGSKTPSLEMGRGVGGAFEPFADGQKVGLTVAPQGGFGVSVVLNTKGLAAGDKKTAEATLEALVDGKVAGTFALTLELLCQSDGSGGLVNGVVIGFDPAVYGTNDALLKLHDKAAVLRVQVKDSEGRTASVEKTVIIQVS